MRSLLLALVVVLVVAVPAQADQVINLGEMIPNGINGHRQVVGATYDNSEAGDAPVHAVIWNSGVLSRLAEPGGTTDSYAYEINAAGRVVGSSTSSGQVHALSWDGPNGAARQLGPLSSGLDDFSSANAVDDAGDIVGNTLDANFKTFGFFAAGGSGLTHVGEGVGGEFGTTTVAGITPDGQRMLGQVNGDSDHPATSGWYLFNSPSDGGVKLDLKLFQTGASILGGAGTPQYANLMASDGSVVGFKGDNATNGTYYLRSPTGAEQLITGLLGHNGVNAKHTVIGTILGTYMGYQVPHAAIWKPDGTVVDLNSLLPANSDYVLGDALGINDNGDIIGLAGQISTGKDVGFLLPAGFVVDSILDDADKTPGDGNCLTAAGACTLRAALQEVNGAKVTTPTSISFNLPGGNGTIKPTSQLPAAQYPVTIDGLGKVALVGTNAGASTSGLILQGDQSSVRGMDIEAFGAAGVRVQASDVSVGGLPTDEPPCTFPCNTFKSNGKGAIAVASGTQNLLEGNRMTGNAKPAIDLGADGRTPNDARDADAGANGLHNFPIGVLAEKDPVSNVRKVSGVNAPDDAGDAIDIYAQSAADATRGAEPTDYAGSTTVGVMGGWSLDVPSTLAANDTFFSATITSGDGTSELSPICTDPDGDGNPDSDGDGLCDTWETTGIDADDNGTIDLTLPNASPTHKDLYVELDTMADGVGHSKPADGAIQDVIDAFAAAPVLNASGGNGIALHANTTFDEEIPEAAFKVTGTGAGTLDGYKQGSLTDPCDGYFGSPADRSAPDCFQRLSARALAYRWGLFGYKYTEGGGSSGFAEGIGGNEFTVTLGDWDLANVLNSGGGATQCPSESACRRIMDAGTMMHEFGHSLGLHHGGEDEDQYKPNYLSVMNYMFQMRGRVRDRPLDYSRWALPSLNEAQLTDASGILVNADLATRVGVQLFWGHTGWYKWGGAAGCQVLTAPTSGTIDWDRIPVTLVSSAPVSDDHCYSDTPAKTLKSYADWPDLRYSFRDQPGASDAPKYAGDTAVHEETDTDLLAEAARNDTDGNGVNDLADSCRLGAGSQFADANGNGFADGCEADMNALQAFPGQQNGAGGGGGGGGGTGGGGGGGGGGGTGGGTAGGGTGGGGAAPPSGPARDTTAPAVSKLSAKPSTATRAKGKQKAKPASLRFTVSETSVVTFTGELAAKGHQSGKKCVAGTKRKTKACTLYKKVSGALRINVKAGANTLAFAAKLGTKKLGAGSYRLTAVAIDAAGNASKPLTVTVTVR